MTDDYPSDVDGDVLRMIAEDGNDMTQPMEVDFHVVRADGKPPSKPANCSTFGAKPMTTSELTNSHTTPTPRNSRIAGV